MYSFFNILGLTPLDAQYFSALVHFNQSKSTEEKTQYLEQMRNLKRKIPRDIVPIDQYAFYSRWYYLVLRELVCIFPWNGDYGKLAKAVNPPIKKSEAQEVVRFLLEKGFISVDSRGNSIQTKKALTSGSEVENSLSGIAG